VELIPAIDLLDGRVVRLSKGAFDAVTEYGDDPVAVARQFEAAGAPRIHIVDLDAAREGRAMQAEVIKSIVAAVDVPCQVAGGIRDADAVAAGLAAGADRLVLGSALVSSPLLAKVLTERYGPDRIVAALDVRDGQALGDGWVEGARGAEVLSLARSLAEKGVRWFAVTAIARDGQMSGPDYELLDAVRAAVPGAAIIGSGGLSSLADIRELASRGFEAAITGRALYEGAFTLDEAIDAARTPSQRRALTTDSVEQAWSNLDPRFRGALAQAWEGFKARGLPVGAVISRDGEIIGEGRNRVYDQAGGADLLQRTPLAHAEMNAIASVAEDTDLSCCEVWTTQQPCSMCQAAIDFTGIGGVHYVASDPSAEPPRAPYRGSGEATEIWTVVANVLFLHGIARAAGSDHRILQENAAVEGLIVDLARDLVEDRALIDAAEADGSLLDALGAIWERLTEVTSERRGTR
jgi:phosphoribosylformimino-5-aminoimidazole carboxamide ribotide isomerase